MTLTEHQRKYYEQVLNEIRNDMEDIDRQIQEEIDRQTGAVKDRLAELSSAKNASRQMYGAACMRLGIPNDLEAEEDIP